MGRKYGLNKYGRYTYDKGIQEPWAPDVPIGGGIEIWVPSPSTWPPPPENWASAITPPPEIWVPLPPPLIG